MRLSLKHLILFVALLSVILTLFSSLTAGYRLNKETLIHNTLETNRVYAQKLSNITDSYLRMTLQTLEMSAKEITTYFEDEEKLLKEADRLKLQTSTFNSVIIADAKGKVLATSPQTLEIKGKTLDSPGGKQALSERKPLISKPYTGITGRLIVFISYPIFDKHNEYIGFVGGTLYLQEQNVLYDILGEHFYNDGSYVYVVDEDGRLIYHQNPDRVNDVASKNPVIQKLMHGKSGAEEVVNTKNIDMLAGYAYIPIANLGVVSQRPTEMALAPANNMLIEMIIKSLPFLILSIIIIWILSKRIALPLQKLAYYTETSTESNQEEKIEKVRAWYYEATQLKAALSHSLKFLHNKVNYFIHQSTTDPLTKLTNRRTMDEYIKKWTESSLPYSVIIFDMDKFKRVNDTYGHTVGDEVLKYLAESMKEVSRKDDVCCRYGGEEFVMLLPETDKYAAYQVAERLRKKLEKTISPCGEIVTVSAGIASFPDCAVHPAELIEKADKCLYQAKNTGRNKCIVFEA